MLKYRKVSRSYYNQSIIFTVLQSVSSRYDLQKNRKKKFLIVCSHEPSVTISHFFILLHFFVLLRIEHGLRHMEERKMIANMCATIFNYILNLTSCHYNPYLDWHSYIHGNRMWFANLESFGTCQYNVK